MTDDLQKLADELEAWEGNGVYQLVDDHRRAVVEALRELEELRAQHQRIMDEACLSGERHCTCVPALRRRVEALEAGRQGDGDER